MRFKNARNKVFLISGEKTPKNGVSFKSEKNEYQRGLEANLIGICHPI